MSVCIAVTKTTVYHLGDTHTEVYEGVNSILFCHGQPGMLV